MSEALSGVSCSRKRIRWPRQRRAHDDDGGVARMSEATSGKAGDEETRMSLRSSELRSLPRAAALQHSGNSQMLVEIGPAHRHDLVVPPLRVDAYTSRGYRSSGVAMRRPSSNVTTSSVPVNSTDHARSSPTSISKVLMPCTQQFQTLDQRASCFRIGAPCTSYCTAHSATSVAGSNRSNSKF
jgi:hypothetical protein